MMIDERDDEKTKQVCYVLNKEPLSSGRPAKPETQGPGIRTEYQNSDTLRTSAKRPCWGLHRTGGLFAVWRASRNLLFVQGGGLEKEPPSAPTRGGGGGGPHLRGVLAAAAGVVGVGNALLVPWSTTQRFSRVMRNAGVIIQKAIDSSMRPTDSSSSASPEGAARSLAGSWWAPPPNCPSSRQPPYEQCGLRALNTMNWGRREEALQPPQPAHLLPLVRI